MVCQSQNKGHIYIFTIPGRLWVGAVRAMRGATMPRRASPGRVVGEDLTKPDIAPSSSALQAWAVSHGRPMESANYAARRHDVKTSGIFELRAIL